MAIDEEIVSAIFISKHGYKGTFGRAVLTVITTIDPVPRM